MIHYYTYGLLGAIMMLASIGLTYDNLTYRNNRWWIVLYAIVFVVGVILHSLVGI